MRFVFVVEAEVEREEGKFASRDDLGGQILSELEGAEPGTLEGENGGQYSVVSWSVELQEA